MSADLVAAALGSAGGVLAVREWGALQARRKMRAAIAAAKPEPDPEPVCGCGHHYAVHYRQEGEERCGHIEVTRVVVSRGKPERISVHRGGYSESSVVYRDEKFEVVKVPCPCVHYTGPEPMPRYLP